MNLPLSPIGVLRSPFTQKFAIPRQPNLVQEAVGELHFEPAFRDPNLLREIEGFSHLWLLFWFHETAEMGWSPTVQPPRLGGKERVGVFASRSPFRPNPIGLSVVRNLGVEVRRDGPVLRLGGVDILDGTPVVDIKPYIHYADSIPDAMSGFAEETPGHDRVIAFTPPARTALDQLTRSYPDLEALLLGVLSQDPRPAWRVKKEDNKRYGIMLYDINIKWHISEHEILITELTRTGPGENFHDRVDDKAPD